jgi:hypothetical protein
MNWDPLAMDTCESHAVGVEPALVLGHTVFDSISTRVRGHLFPVVFARKPIAREHHFRNFHQGPP